MHTPGPWQVTGYHIDAPTGTVATVCDTGDDDAQGAANARLIAKAPDLKAALAWALDQIEDDLDPDHQAALAGARKLLED